MKLELISGQPDANLMEAVQYILASNQYSVIMWPEMTLHHPKKIYDDILAKVSHAIESDCDLLIVTHSDHALNALRVAVVRHKFEGALVHQIMAGPERGDMLAEVNTNGELSQWAPDVFDVWDNAIDELMGLN